MHELNARAGDVCVVRAAIDELLEVLPVERCAGGAIPAIPAPPSPAIFAAAKLLEAEMRDANLNPRRRPHERVAALRALGRRVRALGYPLMEAMWHGHLGAALVAVGDLAGGKAEVERSVRIAEEVGDDESRTRGLINLMKLAWHIGQADTKAIESAAEGAAVRLGNPAILSQLHMTQGMLALASGDVPRARQLLEQARSDLAPFAMEAHSQLVVIAQNLGAVLQASRDFPAAQAVLDQGVELARTRFGDRAVKTLELQGVRATNYLFAGDGERARRELTAVADELASLVGPLTPPVVQARSFQCQAELETRQLPAQSCEDALTSAQRVFGTDQPQIQWQLVLAGRRRILAQKPSEAIPVLEQALAMAPPSAANPESAADHALASAYLAIARHRIGKGGSELAAQVKKALAGLPGNESTLRDLADEFD